MKIRYTDRTPQDITKHKVQKDWASAIKVLKPFKTGLISYFNAKDVKSRGVPIFSLSDFFIG